MATVVRASLDGTDTSHPFRAELADLGRGEGVVVETERGLDLGWIVDLPNDHGFEKYPKPLRPVVRRASPEDIATSNRNRVREREADAEATAQIRSRGLPMQVAEVRFMLDGARAVVSFTAEGRVDFRELVRDLAHRLRVRVEMRQIGPRDAARVNGTVGPCGRVLCCKSWIVDFHPVSVRMAKDQNLSLNPSKISGMCGRLKCCLAYEHPTYVLLRKGLPKIGQKVLTPKGLATVRELFILEEAVRVELEEGGGMAKVRAIDLGVEGTPEQRAAERDGCVGGCCDKDATCHTTPPPKGARPKDQTAH